MQIECYKCKQITKEEDIVMAFGFDEKRDDSIYPTSCMLAFCRKCYIKRR